MSKEDGDGRRSVERMKKIKQLGLELKEDVRPTLIIQYSNLRL